MAAEEQTRLDAAAVEALFAEHSDELRRFLWGVCRDPALADDVLQATFAKATELGHTAREETRKAWLFRVAYNEALAIRRREGIGRKVIREVAWTQQHESDAADRPIVRKETVARIRTAIEGLPTEQQTIVRMRIYDEKTFAVIAEELNIPLGTALGRMRSALEKLRTALREEN